MQHERLALDIGFRVHFDYAVLTCFDEGEMPRMQKRKLNSLDTLRDYNATGDERVYNTFHRCDACLTYFKAVNSKPKVVSSHDEYEAAVRETQLRQPVVS